MAAMQAHPQEAGVQEDGCRALVNVCFGDGAEGGAREQRAATAGAIEAVVAAMQAHPQEEEVQEFYNKTPSHDTGHGTGAHWH